MESQAAGDDLASRLMTMPCVGPITSSVLAAELGDGKQFKCGRGYSASIGLVPKQHSTGGKTVLLGISKRGDAYLRRQLVNGARSLVRIACGRTGHLWDWINSLMSRRAFNVVTVAVANKLARIVWAIQARGTRWRVA